MNLLDEIDKLRSCVSSIEEVIATMKPDCARCEGTGFVNRIKPVKPQEMTRIPCPDCSDVEVTFRADPPRETWPEPPKGERWGRIGWGLDAPFRPGARYFNGGKWWRHPLGGNLHSLYLDPEPEPIPEPKLVPFSGPEDAVCDMRWIRANRLERVECVFQYNSRSLTSAAGYYSWGGLFREGWEYTDNAYSGVWHPFAKAKGGADE